MASKGVTTDLVIRAKEIQTKPIADLVGLLAKLTGALDALDKEGGPATRNIAELRSEAEKFAALGSEISARRGLFEAFTSARDGAKLAAAALDEAKKKLAEFSEGLPAAKARTAEQAQDFEILSKAVKSAATALRNADRTAASSAQALAKIGVDANQAATELQALAEADKLASDGFVRATKNVQGYHQAVRDLAKATTEKAAADKQAADAARRAEQAESDRLALLEQAGRRQQAAAGKSALAAENANIAEAAALTKRLADATAAQAKASRDAEQAESDRLARILERGKAEQAAAGKSALAAENANIAEAAALTKRLAAEEQQRATALKATADALRAQRTEELAAAGALREQGAAAALAATESRKLALAAEQVAKAGAAAGPGLGEQVAGIVNPARAAALSLQQVGAALEGLEARQKRANATLTPSRELIKALGEDHAFLAKALKDTERQAAAIEGYRKVSAEMERTGAALRAAQDALEQYSAQARSAGTSDDTLEKGLATQRAQLAALTAAYAAQGTAVARMADQMRQAGVEVTDLARAEAEVISNANRLRNAMDAASSTTSNLGNATARARKETSLWGEEQRTALSLTQRIRGQILSLTAAYVGLFGVINEAKSSLEAVTTMQGINNRLAVAFGDEPAVVAAELGRLRAETDRLGISLKESGEAYSKFAIASRSAGMSADETFFIFSKFAEISRVYKLTGEQQGRVFKALEQMMSKGKISAEELNQQLGDVLPGAVPIFTKAIYGAASATAQLNKDMANGKLSSKNLLLVAKEVGEQVKSRVEQASQSWQSELDRMGNAVLEFRNQVGESGFAEAMSELARSVTSALRSDEGKKFAGELSAAFSFVADTLRLAIPILQGFMSALRDVGGVAKEVTAGFLTVSAAIREFLGLKPSSSVLDLNESLRELGRILGIIAGLWATGKIIAFATALRAVTVEVAALSLATKSLSAAGAGLIGFELGTWLVDNTKWAQKLVIAMSSLASMTLKLAGGDFQGVKDEYALWGMRLADVDKQVGQRNGAPLPATGAGGGRGMVNPEPVSTLTIPPPTFLGDDKGKEAAAAAKKLKDEYASLLKLVESGTKTLELRGAKKGANEVEEAVAAIEQQYQDLFANIAKLSAADQAKFLPRAEAAKAKVIAETRADMEAKAAMAKVEALVAERDALIDVAKAQAGLDTGKAITEEARLVGEYRLKLLDAAKAALVLAEAQGKTLDVAKLRGQIARLEASDPQQDADRAKLAALQAEITRLTAERDARIAASAARATAAGEPVDSTGLGGMPSDEERVALMTEYQGRLTDAATKARELAVALGDPTTAAGLTTLITQLQVVDTKAAEIKAKLVTDLQQGLADVGYAAVEGFAGFIAGANSIGEAFASLRASFKSFAADFLKQIVQMIIKAQVLALWQAITGAGAGSASAGGGAGTVAGGSGFQVRHAGGVIGSGSSNWSRAVPAAVFAGAAAFHTGGLPGLKSDEVPAILQKGEEVLSRDNPRNVLNGGMMAGAPAAVQPTNIKIVNTIDAGDAVSQGLSTPAGDKAFINRVVANKATIKKLLT